MFKPDKQLEGDFINITVRFPENDHAKLKELAEKSGLSLKKFCRQAIYYAVESMEETPNE